MIYKLKITVAALVFALSTICLLPTGAATQQECYHYTYSSDYEGNHYSLIKNNSILIGNDITIISNCQYTFNSEYTPSFTTQQNDTIQLPLDTTWISIKINNNTYLYDNLTIYPASEFNYNPIVTTDQPTTTNEDLFTSELLAHVVTFAILFLMSTNVVYHLASRKIDNTIEVII